MDAPVFLSATGRIRAADAVAALLQLEDGRYLMQLRDPKPDIFYPDHWGCFGGAVDAGETPEQTLRRELREELELAVTGAREFTRFDFDFGRLGQRKVYRIYYEAQVANADYSRLVLHEGARLEAFAAAEILSQPRVTPYDAFAIWLHSRRDRFRP